FQALRKKADHFWAQFSLALCEVRKGQFIAARVNLTSCLAQQKEVRIYLLCGFVQGQLGEYGEAEADFNEAAEELRQRHDVEMLYALYNNRAVTQLGLARDKSLQQARERYGKAKADLEAAIKLVPGQYQAHVTLAEVYRLEG